MAPPCDAAMRGLLGNTQLWVTLNARGMGRVSEWELTTIVFEALLDEYGEDSVKPEDLLGVQYLPPKQCWIIYLANQTSKGKLLALDNVNINGNSYELSDFSKVGIKTENKRISIHGVPLHVSDDEIEQWLDQYIIRDTPVKLQMVKDREKHFKTLFNGNRFCYAKKIVTPMPRYMTLSISDPLEIAKPHPGIMDIRIVVYHEDQVINCKNCLDLSHPFQECPKWNNRKANQRTCYRCNQYGHLARDCDVDAPGDDSAHTDSFLQQLSQYPTPELYQPHIQSADNLHIRQDNLATTCSDNHIDAGEKLQQDEQSSKCNPKTQDNMESRSQPLDTSQKAQVQVNDSQTENSKRDDQRSGNLNADMHQEAGIDGVTRKMPTPGKRGPPETPPIGEKQPKKGSSSKQYSLKSWFQAK